MTAVPEVLAVEAGVSAPSATSERVARAVDGLPAIDLRALDAGAALLTRVDRKYVVPVAAFERLVLALDDSWTALEIEGRRQFGYSSVYFDTPDFVTYRAHVQGRRHRYKVRVRRYIDSDDCMLEVKRKGARGLTIKERRDHSIGSETELGNDGRAFVEGSLRGHGALAPVAALDPVVVTGNRRTTLACLSGHSRLTIDSDLACGWGHRHSLLRPGMVVLESKVDGHASQVDRLLRSFGIRPVPISKYCVGVASLGLNLPSNPWRRTMRSYFDIPDN
jgi:VTC domain